MIGYLGLAPQAFADPSNDGHDTYFNEDELPTRYRQVSPAT